MKFIFLVCISSLISCASTSELKKRTSFLSRRKSSLSDTSTPKGTYQSKSASSIPSAMEVYGSHLASNSQPIDLSREVQSPEPASSPSNSVSPTRWISSSQKYRTHTTAAGHRIAHFTGETEEKWHRLMKQSHHRSVSADMHHVQQAELKNFILQEAAKQDRRIARFEKIAESLNQYSNAAGTAAELLSQLEALDLAGYDQKLTRAVGTLTSLTDQAERIKKARETEQEALQHMAQELIRPLAHQFAALSSELRITNHKLDMLIHAVNKNSGSAEPTSPRSSTDPRSSGSLSPEKERRTRPAGSFLNMFISKE